MWSTSIGVILIKMESLFFFLVCLPTINVNQKGREMGFNWNKVIARHHFHLIRGLFEGFKAIKKRKWYLMPLVKASMTVNENCSWPI